MHASTYNPYLECPYDRSHQVPKLKLQFHLVKCRKQHPDLASLLKTCPYNATHIMPETELECHYRFCKEKNLDDLENYDLHSRQGGELGKPSFHHPVASGDWGDSDEDDQHLNSSSQQFSISHSSIDCNEKLPGGALGISLRMGENSVAPRGLVRGRLKLLLDEMARDHPTT